MPCNKLIEKRIKLRWRQPLDKLPRWPHFSTSAGRSIDHLRAGYMITEHLLKLGCRRIAFVAYWVFLTKTAKSQFVSQNSDLSPAPRRPYRGLPPRD
jgi:hypothetical protein